MPISNNTFISTLVKKILFKVTQTDHINKEGSNEAIPSPLQVFSDDILVQAGSIPRPAPSSSTAIVEVYTGSNRIECREDPSVIGSKTWLAVRDPSISRDDEFSPGVPNALTDWIPPSIDPSYLVDVYAGDPETTGVQLNPLATDEEWLFDYSAGVLYFPNNVPNSVINDGIYIVGYRYVGSKGISAGSGSLMEEESFSYTTSNINDSQFEDFTLQTGKMSQLLNLEVNVPCYVEAHSDNTYSDTNPYKFRAIPGRLFDDGSYVINTTRIFGPRYATLIGDNSSTTYWRIINDSGDPAEITVNLTVLKI